MPPSDVGLLDRLAERGARRLAERTTGRSVLGRVGDRLLTLTAPPAPVAAPPTAATVVPTSPEPAAPTPSPEPLAAALAVTEAKPPTPSPPAPAAANPPPAPPPSPPAPVVASPPAARLKLAVPTPQPTAPTPPPAEPAVTPVPGPATATSPTPDPASLPDRQPEPAVATPPRTPAPPVVASPVVAAPVPEPAPPRKLTVVPDPAPPPVAEAPAAPPLEPSPPTPSVTIAGNVVVIPPDAVAATVAISQARYEPGSKPTVVLAQADPLILAIAAPLAAALDAPLLAVDGTISLVTATELGRLGSNRRIAVGLELPDTEPIVADDLAALSFVVAGMVRKHAGTVRAFAIADSDTGRAVAGPVAAAAALRRFAVMIGADAARKGSLEGEQRAAVTYLIGADIIGAAGTVPGGFPLPAPTPQATAARLSQLLRADGVLATTDTVATTTVDTAPAVSAALAAAGGPVQFAEP